MRLSDATEKTRQVSMAPRALIELQPDDFNDGHKPEDTVVAGLRLISLEHRSSVKLRVAQYASDYATSDREAMVRLYCSYGLCDPNDFTKPWVLFKFAQDDAFTKLTDTAARRVFDALERLEVTTGVSYAEATPDDIISLYNHIAEGRLAMLHDADHSAVLRHLRFALEILETPGQGEESPQDKYKAMLEQAALL